jgi:hypothetical protein
VSIFFHKNLKYPPVDSTVLASEDENNETNPKQHQYSRHKILLYEVENSGDQRFSWLGYSVGSFRIARVGNKQKRKEDPIERNKPTSKTEERVC